MNQPYPRKNLRTWAPIRLTGLLADPPAALDFISCSSALPRPGGGFRAVFPISSSISLPETAQTATFQPSKKNNSKSSFKFPPASLAFCRGLLRRGGKSRARSRRVSARQQSRQDVCGRWLRERRAEDASDHHTHDTRELQVVCRHTADWSLPQGECTRPHSDACAQQHCQRGYWSFLQRAPGCFGPGGTQRAGVPLGASSAVQRTRDAAV